MDKSVTVWSRIFIDRISRFGVFVKFNKLILFCLVISAIWASFDDEAKALIRKRKDPFKKAQLGVWFGPVTPVFETRKDVDTSLGGGMYIRSATFLDYFKFGIDTSYQYHKSPGNNTLTLWPTYGNLLYRLPLNLPLTFQLKAGAGASYVKIRPDLAHQWDPVFMTGIEMSFPAGKVVNIGLRIDYLMIYEQYIPGATRNGHVVNTGITLYFNLF